jgi:hypothetical protein
VQSPRRTVALIAAATLVGWAGAAAARPRHRPFHRHQKNKDGEVIGHYSDRGAKPAKVTVGDLTLRSRALLGKDGMTTLELSTAPFDVDATPLGNISSVHIRAIEQVLKKDGKEEWKNDKDEKFHKEYDHLKEGGYVSWKFAGLPHGQGLGIEAKAKGTAHRDEVEAKLVDVVGYRPDLLVRDMAVPPVAAPGAAVFITATVLEQLGELGASADCVLLVDGAQVDSTPIWVAASGVVTCSFATKFVVGKHSVSVRAQNVRPGDYDDSNNQLSASIDVHNLVSMYYDALALEDTSTFYSAQDFYVTSTSTSPERHLVLTNQTFYSQSRMFFGWLPIAVNLPVSVAFSEGSGGRTLNQLTVPQPELVAVPVDDPTSYTAQSTYSQEDDSNGSVVTITRYYNANLDSGMTTVSVQWSATEANYHSESWCRSTAVFQCSGGDFTKSSDSPSASGLKLTLADDYTADLTVNDGASYTGHAVVPLTAFGSRVAVTNTNCWPMNFRTDGTIGKSCITTSNSDYGKSGAASLQP